METEAIQIGVVMQRRHIGNRWQPYAWSPVEVVHDTGVFQEPTCIGEDEADWRWLFSGIQVSLYTDEAEGYFLNATSPEPCWFIMWRLEEHNGLELAMPKTVTLSYNAAARMMDAGEQVDTLPLQKQLTEHLLAFANAYYQPEPRKKRRKPSFEGGAEIEQMAQVPKDADGC